VPKDSKEVSAGLQKKGFAAREGDHTFYHLIVNGKKTVINTKISHGEKEIGDKLLGMMARQLRLSRRDFLNLVDCPLSLDEYLLVLRQAGHIDP
jgi:predicted RNA binding protein YcfA (HicA-like mRNA interferase family)